MVFFSSSLSYITMALKALVFVLVSLFVVVSQASHATPPPPKVPAVAPVRAPYVPSIVRAPHPPTPVRVRAPPPPPIIRRTPLPPVRVRAPLPPIRRRAPPPPVTRRAPPPPYRSRAPPPPFTVRAPPPPVKARTPPPPYTTRTPPPPGRGRTPPPPAKVTYPPPPPAVVKSPPAKVQSPVPLSACHGLCLTRCGKHSRPNRCMRACESCCKECRCVPTGTHSNYKTCPPCYHQKRTKDGKHKCP
ncbi:hypothetical protein C5167_029133 [Papaver somniferum]|nr:hypothetical protein C5167_029133 [Papaver somniferum]